MRGCSAATQDDALCPLLLDQPHVMGVESIQVDTINVRMVARTLPGKQFEVGRELRALIANRLSRAEVRRPSGQHRESDGLAGRISWSARWV